MIKKIKYFILLLFLGYLLYPLYKYVPYRIEFLGHYDKIWAHRNNSVIKATIAEKYFKGIELDLVYNQKENLLDVTHPPVKSIHLNFSNYISKLEKQPYLWLDIKNLNINNAQLIYNKLNTIFIENTYLKNKILIETRFPEALPFFTSAGFKTSYYLPFDLSKMNESDLNNNVNHIKSVLNKQPEIGISAIYEDYEIMNEHFPNRTKYTWIIDGLKHRKYRLANRVLKDTTVAVVLISFKTFKGHR